MSASLPILGRSDLLTREPAARPLIPGRKPAPGEQYRFHFDMSRCIGCKCCVVACNEQNGNPPHIQWRRVGEIEGGVYPNAQRWHLSMGCNHCLEPSCLTGCPVEAYTKDALTGIVDHSAELCIGCQYCIWNCSYGVPQFNEERGVVGKCDMCHGRLNAGLSPACVNACPENAIGIEIINVAEWRRDFSAADAPGLPSSKDSLSTTRVTVPEMAIEGLSRVDLERVEPQDPHWSLIVMLVLTQLSAGAVTVLWVLGLLGRSPERFAVAVPAMVTAIALAAVTLHLGRPAFAWRALRMWRRSWLSREVAALGLFAALSQGYAATVWYGSAWAALLGGLATATGFLGVVCSARIYMVPARPAWNLHHTMTEFLLSAAVLGPALALALGAMESAGALTAATGMSAAQLLNLAAKIQWMRSSPIHELRSSAVLLFTALKSSLTARFALGVGATAALWIYPPAAFLLALAGELTGRYLFFTAVVPKRVGAAYLSAKEAA